MRQLTFSATRNMRVESILSFKVILSTCSRYTPLAKCYVVNSASFFLSL